MKEPKGVEVVETKENEPAISLNQLNKQTVDFKGRPVKAKEAPKQTERPRIEPPPIRDRQAPKVEDQVVKPTQQVPKKTESAPIMPPPPPKIEEIVKAKPVPAEAPAPAKPAVSVNLLDQFKDSDSKNIKEGEDVEL
jgi:hypothetical protein